MVFRCGRAFLRNINDDWIDDAALGELLVDGNFKQYSYVQSSRRIKEILDQPGGVFEEVEGLPGRDKLTFTNGFYGTCSALFIDIRDSSERNTSAQL